MRHNPRYAVTDPGVVRTLIAENPWATIVSHTEAGIVASHYPVLLDDRSDELAVLTHVQPARIATRDSRTRSIERSRSRRTDVRGAVRLVRCGRCAPRCRRVADQPLPCAAIESGSHSRQVARRDS
ncbi:FMN-binding negative transcriptional regulator [Conexibacter sp. CPCC 206217]|uniref:FMN-binding negative transcriptional regulator n=1 Tax=Conexibacter sp. CPCC 206217 TaxID=3064574 RepID=UPI00351C723C